MISSSVATEAMKFMVVTAMTISKVGTTMTLYLAKGIMTP